VRSHPRIDKNHAEIVAAFRQMKCQVQSLASIGGGCPDLLVGVGGCYGNVLVEVKSAKGKLTPDQNRWVREWTGGQVFIVRSVDDAIELVTRCRR
jgi:N-acetylmuramic acid 6-phosphate (MurNAc-6-P) etherase